MNSDMVSNIFVVLFVFLGLFIFLEGYLIGSNFLRKDNLRSANEFLRYIDSQNAKKYEQYQERNEFGDDSDE